MNILDFVSPKKCLGCKKPGLYICPECILKVTRPKTVCPECERASVDGFTHTKCQKKLGINGLFSIWDYGGVIRKALIALKYKYATDIVNELVGYSLSFLKEKEILFPKNCFLVSIPLHWYRENYRGFNQSEAVGRVIAKEFGWKFSPDLLIRKKLSTPQVNLEGKARVENIKGVFVINPSCVLNADSYILFDDVYTTGSTMKEASKVLKRNGAGKVWGLTIAR